MKNYSLKTKANSSRTSSTLHIKRTLFVVGAVLLLVSAPRLLGVLTSFVATPLLGVRHYIETSSAVIPVYLRDRAALQSEIESLTQRIEDRQGVEEVFRYIEAENAELRALLGDTESPSILAGVVARPPLSPYDTLVIDKGAKHGIVEHAAVYYGSGLALGYVQAVYEYYSVVSLFSSPQVSATVYVFGANIFTTAFGEGGGIVRLSIPQGVPIAEHDVVVLPSVERGVLGTVYAVQSVPAEPEQHAYVALEVPLQGIRNVRVSTKPQVPVSFEEAIGSVGEFERLLFAIPVDTNLATTSSSTEPNLEESP